jgi:hypothetical protein
MKECSICKEIKTFDDFPKRSNRTSGRQPYCKKCHNEKTRNNYCSNRMKDYDLKKNYGIDLNEYEIMFSKQNGCCAICETHITKINSKHKKHLCVDHNHETKQIRGLLCDKCNRGLGLFCDDKNILLKAINYLNNFKLCT